MRVGGSNNIVLTDPTLLRYASAITKEMLQLRIIGS